MQIHLTGHKLLITDALRQYATDKLVRLEKYCNKITSIHVVFGVDRSRQHAEAVLHIAKQDVYARSESSDLYDAIDHMIHKLDRQLIKYKEKHHHH